MILLKAILVILAGFVLWFLLAGILNDPEDRSNDL
jgi:hypothetical protein